MNSIRTILALGIVVTAPTLASAQDGTSSEPASESIPPPTGEGTSTGVDGYLFTTGFLMFGVPYSISVMEAQGSYDTGHHGNLYAPVVGPWIDLANRPSCTAAINTCDHATRTDALLIADGLFQAGGVLVMIDALFLGHRAPAIADDTKLHLTPTTYAGTGGGLNVFARF